MAFDVAENMKNKGWEDAIEGCSPAMPNSENYMRGYNQGVQDLGENDPQ